MKYKHHLFTFLMAIISIGLPSSVSSEALVVQDSLMNSTQDKNNAVILASKEKQVQQKIREYLITNHISGSIAVVKNKKKIFADGVGYSDISNQTLNSPATSYPIGSITKTIVAV